MYGGTRDAMRRPRQFVGGDFGSGVTKATMAAAASVHRPTVPVVVVVVCSLVMLFVLFGPSGGWKGDSVGDKNGSVMFDDNAMTTADNDRIVAAVRDPSADWRSTLADMYDGDAARWRHDNGGNDDNGVYCFTVTGEANVPLYDVCSDEFLDSTPCPCWDRMAKLRVAASGSNGQLVAGAFVNHKPMQHACLPCATLVGMPKTSSTTVFSLMRQHPLAASSRAKEPNIWGIGRRSLDMLTTKWIGADALVKAAREAGAANDAPRAIDWTVNYVNEGAEEETLTRISSHLPRAPIAMMLREPVGTDISDYWYWNGEQQHMEGFDSMSPTERAEAYHSDLEAGFRYIETECISFPAGRTALKFDAGRFAELGCSYEPGSVFEQLVVRGGRINRPTGHVKQMYSYHVALWSARFRFGSQFQLFTLDELHADVGGFFARLEAHFNLPYVPVHSDTPSNVSRYAKLVLPESVTLLRRQYAPFNCHLAMITDDMRYLAWNHLPLSTWPQLDS